MTDIKLKPCPFCGGRHIETAENLDLVYCFDCGAEMHTDLGGSWNNRPIEDALNARIAELEAENERLSQLLHDEMSQLEIATDYGGDK